MLGKRITYLLLFVFCTWLALATRSHRQWFAPVIAVYGGDIIWSGMFVFLLRIFFCTTPLWKLVLITYVMGVVDEVSQLWQASWLVSIRHTYIGRLLLGQGFLWSDIICYAIGVLIAWLVCLLIEHCFQNKYNKHVSKGG